MLRKILEVLKPSKQKTIFSGGKSLIGEILVMRDKCTNEQVLEALEQQRIEGAGRRIGNLLLLTCNLSQDDIREALEIQSYLREEVCANKSMKKLEEATKNFIMQKEIFLESLQNVHNTLDEANGTLDNI